MVGDGRFVLILENYEWGDYNMGFQVKIENTNTGESKYRIVDTYDQLIELTKLIYSNSKEYFVTAKIIATPAESHN